MRTNARGEPAAPSAAQTLALFAFALALRLPMLWRHELVEGDGVHYARLAEQVLRLDWSGLANPYWSNLWPGVMAAAAWLTGLDVVTAGRVAALLAGAGLAPVTAWLASRWLGRETGLLSGLLVAGQPWLLLFSTLVFTESLFALLAMGVLCCASWAEGWRGFAATGLLGGLAVVTRPEGQAGVLVAVVFVACRSLDRGRGVAVGRAALVLALVGTFVLARAALVRHYDGPWDFGFGLKGSANLLVGLAASDEERERLATETTADDESRLSREAEAVSLPAYAWAHPASFGRLLARNATQFLASATRVLPPLPPEPGRPPVWSGAWPPPVAAWAWTSVGLCCWGWWRSWRRPGAAPGVALMTAAGGLQLAGLSMTLVHDRLLVSLAPLFAVFLAQAFRELRARLWPGLAGARGLGLALGAQGLVLAALVWRSGSLDYANEAPVQREAGEWLRARYSQEVRTVSGSSFVTFYFYDSAHADRESSLPWTDAGGLLAVARRREAGLLVLPEWHLRATHHPATVDLLDRPGSVPGLRIAAVLGNELRGRVFVYEVDPPPGATEAPP